MADTLSVSDIPGATEAFNAILNDVAAWQQLPPKLDAYSTQAMAVQDAARTAGNGTVQATMALDLGRIGPLRESVQATVPQLGDVLAVANALRQGQQPSISASLIAEAVQLAFTIGDGLNTAQGIADDIAGMAPQVLSPQQIASLNIGSTPARSTVPLSTMLTIGAGLVVLALLWRNR